MDNLNQEIQILDEARQMRNLANAVRLADSFSLLFVRCNQRPRQKEIIEELKGELVDYKIKVVFLENQIEHLLDELQARLGKEKPDVIFVYGLESSLPKADEAAESKFVITLNHSRNSFKRVLDCPLVLFVPEYALSAIYHGATDFYSIRSGVYLFSAKAEETEELMLAHNSQGFKKLEGLLYEERRNRINAIQSLLIEYQSLPDLQRNSETENKLKGKLAELYYISGDYNTASSMYQKLIQDARKSRNVFLLAKNLNGLVMIYNVQHKYEEAVIMQEEVIKLTEEVIGTEHPDYATSLNNLATTYASLGKYDDAIKLSKNAIEIDEKTIGTNNPNYAQHLNTLAAIYQEQGRYSEAMKLYEESLNIVKQTLGVRSLDYANRLNNLAVVYVMQEKYQKALRLYREAYQICVKILGKNHHRTQNIKDSIEECQTRIKGKANLLIPYKK